MTQNTQILMCPPEHYTVDYEINPWMKTWRKPDKEQADQQWNRLVHTLTDLRVTVHLIDSQPNLPDMVFTANAGLVFDKIFIPSNFRFPQRQNEKGHFVSWFKKKGFEIVPLPDDLFFEGQGDALMAGDCLVAGYKIRSDIRTHQTISQIINRKVISVELINPDFYHLDTCFCPLGDDRALYYPQAFDNYAVQALKNVVAHLIPVSETDAASFCCNSIVLGDQIILNQCGEWLSSDLEKLGLNPLLLDFDQFMKAGGSAKCLSLIL